MTTTTTDTTTRETSGADLDAVVARATEAAGRLPALEPRVRAAALDAAAAALDGAADELIALAGEETGLGVPRLTGELRRTRVQLRLFAREVERGAFLDVRIDEADADFALGVPRDDLRRMLSPVGPVLVFAAGNFPFAFSVAGGDTAAALAAGCPVVVKAHPGHPRLSRRVTELVAAALEQAGLPAGTLQLVEGQQAGVDALRHPGIRASSFTGSLRGGRALADIAAGRPDPIPFYGELGSVNPVVALPGAVAAQADSLLEGYVTSVSGSAGQLCTKPGFLLVPTGTDLDTVTTAAAGVAEQRLLSPAISDGYEARRDTVLATPGVTVLHEGGVRRDDDGQGWATPTLVACSLDTLRAHADTLLDEAFGPLSVVVAYEPGTDLAAVVLDLFPGNLTGTLLGANAADTGDTGDTDAAADLARLVDALTRTSGRVLFRGWPTGVAVTPAMQHGGPWPATTTDATSVGTAAVGRFLRGVAYQGAPQSLLPAPLRDDNPWGVPQSRGTARESQRW
ncbi:aldehyde dehydrogenase (NADP(+)) [Terracoccus luteus]|uniref:NADP-dependent aldehyde dehydrogenase n=1 Tax=Terracoccus luteus TaxID=53356 RepID=A0A839PLT1_9MICO|nr:aldehyde dehydrogenase (NADP(+)) [Terracoccus luteus]MBB2985240.1 NADP-dependent aldehyde dehydrogenase [Terracoccus luteus]MCP2170892.1 NADP-dependent aldehyde dehydrogenase [Terracoccus luteus]